MINANEELKSIDTEFEGQYTLESKSKDGVYYNVMNHEDGSTFPIKKTTFKRNVDSKKYTLCEDGSFNMSESKSLKIEWL